MMNLVAKTFAGLEDELAQELRSIGAKNIRPIRRAVLFQGDLTVLYKANIWCRTALAVLIEIERFYAKTTDDLYHKSKAINWSKYLLTEQTFSVHAVTHSKIFDHSKFTALKVKDAIADFYRDIYGMRPNVDRKFPDVPIEVHARENKITILLNASGDALFKRGYRLRTGLAPMNECLAAGIVLKTGYNGTQTLIDFACGSGTILFEAGLIAKNVAPGVLGRRYAFQKWVDYDAALFEKLIQEAKEAIQPTSIDIKGYDIDRKMIGFSRANKEQLIDWLEDVRFFQSDLREVDAPKTDGIIIANLPFDERLKVQNIGLFYEQIGNKLKRDFSGYRAFLFSTNIDALKRVGLRHTSKTELYSGGLKGSLREYRLYDGSKKKKHLSKEELD